MYHIILWKIGEIQIISFQYCYGNERFWMSSTRLYVRNETIA